MVRLHFVCWERILAVVIVVDVLREIAVVMEVDVVRVVAIVKRDWGDTVTVIRFV